MGRQGELKDNPILPMNAQQERMSSYEQEMKRLYQGKPLVINPISVSASV